MLNVFYNIRQAYDLTMTDLNLGGGMGIQYMPKDDPPNVEWVLQRVAERVRLYAEKINYPLPRILVEPGRSIIGTAGLTLYKAGAVKEIPRTRKYVSVDGGMGDNIRPSLYQAQYMAVVANKINQPAEDTIRLAGKYCESGDILISDMVTPRIDSGDIIIVFATGAYNYSMASNYNRIPRPATVLLENGHAHQLVKRESYETIIQHDQIPAHLMGKSTDKPSPPSASQKVASRAV